MTTLFKHIKAKEWLMFIIAVGFITTQVWLDLRLPEYMRRIMTELNVEYGVSINTSAIWRLGASMLGFTLLSALASIIIGFLISRVAAILGKRLRELVFNKTQTFSNAEIKNFSTASLITRTTNDVTQVQMWIAMGMQILVRAPIMAIWALSIVATMSWQWTAATGVAVAVISLLILILVLTVIPKFRRIQKLQDNLTKVTRENLTGLRVVRAYNAEEFEQSKFEGANQDITKNHLFTGRMMGLLDPVIWLVMNFLTVGIFVIGAVLISQAPLSPELTERGILFANMTVFSTYAMFILMSFMLTVMVFAMLPRAQVSANRIKEVLKTKTTVINGHLVNPVTELKGVLELNNVSFKYPSADESVLKNINLKINQGETVAFIGSTGSGKSTLINLIPRFYDATEGEVLLDGINVKEYQLASLHNKLAYVSQRPTLFNGSVYDNVTLGTTNLGKPSIEEVEHALKLAQSDFVFEMEEGLTSPIKQDGKNLSGGQKQRISIARAIARNPEIIIFDDSFSALDYKTDKKLRAALAKNLKDTTCLIVAQRIGTIKNADKIIVLHEGEIVGAGKHQELLKNCAVYKEIALSQLSEEELANDQK